MADRGEWFGGPVEGVVFALVMVMAAFLGRENPRFIYPEILYCFLGLLAFNLLNFSVLPRLLTETRRIALAVGLNILALTLVDAWYAKTSGEQRDFSEPRMNTNNPGAA